MATDLRIAYLISCYRLPGQVVRLVNRLDHPNDIFLIHLDKRSDASIFKEMHGALSGRDNVVFLKRHTCNYCDFGHVRATLKGINYLRMHDSGFTNLVVLTGQDYPIHSTKRTREMIMKAHNSIEYFKLPTSNWSMRGLDRIHFGHYWLRGRHFVIRSKYFQLKAVKLLKRLLKYSGEPSFYGGSSYFQIERQAALYIDEVVRADPSIVSFFKRTYIPDELFFQTLLLNSKFKQSIHNTSRRYVDWSDPKEVPKVMRIADIPSMRASNAIFARKFDEAIDPKVIKRLEQVDVE